MIMDSLYRKQDSGHWFYNIGGSGIGSRYYVTLTSGDGRQHRHLIQGGKEVYEHRVYVI